MKGELLTKKGQGLKIWEISLARLQKAPKLEGPLLGMCALERSQIEAGQTFVSASGRRKEHSV